MAENKSTKGRIISAAWALFYEKGYDNTTIDEIVEKSNTSKGSFYHYFEGKDALLSSLSWLFDEKYDELKDTLPNDESAISRLLFLNKELFLMIENSVSIELLARLFSSQLVTRSDRHLLDQNRSYYRLIKKIVREGQDSGELSKDFSINEIAKAYAVAERGLMYDWCLCSGDYSLSRYSSIFMKHLLEGYRA